MIKAGICGAQGDVAAALIKILVFHPDVNVIWIYDNTLCKKLDHHYRWLTGDTELSIINKQPDTFAEADVIFVVDRPTGFDIDAQTLPDDVKVIDLTGEHCLDDQMTYGLSEINRKLMVRNCRLVAVPGELAHAAELALLPLAKNLMITGNVDVDIMKGVSDGGVGILNDSHTAKKEIERLLLGVQASFNSAVQVNLRAPEQPSEAFVVRASLACSTGLDVLHELFESYYDDHNFTYLVDSRPEPEDVSGTNKCFLYLERDGDNVVITAAIDGRLKGCAGTAVHDMNLLFGLHERVGLETF